MYGRRVRILLIADTHLGLGPQHFSRFEQALQPAFRREVDLVVHGGDVFFRSRVKPGLVFRAFEPLKRIADSGVPVVVVPGNHERSAIPFPLLAAHPCIHIFDRPRTITLDVRGTRVAFAGFPNERDRIRERFGELVERTEWKSAEAGVRLLCLHQTVEGATVGPVGYMFRDAPDVIPRRAIPSGFAAVLAGHIHRHQVLREKLSAPVFYPGSTERTSSAERFESKGYLVIDIAADGRIHEARFDELSPVRSRLPLSESARS